MLGRIAWPILAMVSHVGPMFGLCWAYVGPMLGPCWAHVGPMLGHVEPRFGNLADLRLLKKT